MAQMFKVAKLNKAGVRCEGHAGVVMISKPGPEATVGVGSPVRLQVPLTDKTRDGMIESIDLVAGEYWVKTSPAFIRWSR